MANQNGRNAYHGTQDMDGTQVITHIPASEPQAAPDLSSRLTACEAATEERFADIAALGHEIARLEAALAQKDTAFRAMLARKDADIAALTEQVDHIRPGGLVPDQAELIIAELSRQLDIRDRTLAEVVADRNRVVAMVEEIFGTSSWKATAPLRKLKRMLRGAERS